MERDPEHPRRLGERPEADLARQAVAVIAVVQAGVLGLLARRGSWWSDDIDFLVDGSHGLWPDRLLTPVNDHIAPGLRFVYAVFAEVAPLNHDVTIAWRVLMQALAVWLMGRLLWRLTDRAGLVLAGTFLYAATPLSMPSFMSLSSGVNNLPSHVFGVLLLHATLDWFDGRRRRALGYGPLALLASLLFWEKSVLILVTALALALWRRESSWRDWLRTAWPYAVALAIPLAGFGAAYLALRIPGSGEWPGAGTVAGLLGTAGTSVVLPALVGGPWLFVPAGQPFGLAEPPDAAPVLGAVVLLFALLVCWRRDRRVLFVWGSAGVYYLATVALVAYGRFALFGSALAVHHHYWSDFSIPLVLAVVLTLRAVRPAVAWRRASLVAAGCCALALWSAGTVASTASFAEAWGRNPTKPYFATLRAELEAAGPTVNLWDTTAPTSILTVLSPDRRVSSILEMARFPVVIQGPAGEPRIIDEAGRVRPATLTVWAEAEFPRRDNSLCDDVPIGGLDSVTLPLNKRLDPADWFVRVGYLSNPEHALRVELLDRETGQAVQVPSRTARWPASVATMYLGPARARPDAVRLTSLDPAENICVSKVEVGLPAVTR